MIKSAQLTNFFSHKDTFVEFHKGVNVIVGPTDSGKSALLYALDFAIWNYPSGNACRSWSGGITSVEVNVDGNLITRVKDKADLYKLNKTEFKAFGKTGVPEDIEKTFNMGEVNVQRQLDSHFLLSETSGFVASYFNKIANIEKIDTSTKSIKSEIRKVNQVIETKKEDLILKQKDLKQYAQLPALEKDILKVEKAEKSLNKIENQISTIETNLNTLTSIEAEIHQNSMLTANRGLLINVLKDFALKKEYDTQYNKLRSLFEELSEVETQIQVNKKLKHASKEIDALYSLHEEQNVLSTEISVLNTLLANYTQTQNKLHTAKENHAASQNKYITQLKQLQVCPTCLQKIN